MSQINLFYFHLIKCLLFCSCMSVKALKKMNDKTADYETWTNGDGKSVVFLPMVHAGKAEFYEDVKTVISRYKKEGYLVFYEGVKKDYKETLADDSSLREKYTNYAKHTRYAEMNFEDTDSID